MSAKDSQFIERALVHPWMFWVFFWKWPRIVRQICSEYDLVARDRDAAKAAHEQAIAANEKVRKWIHVTHQLDATADLRAIWTAGKRLSILLALFIATNAFGQAPPYLRNQWTTNANPIAVKVISTNGVQAATNVWALDFTNTASVSVNVVSNAGKVVFSFIGATNSGGSSSLTNALLHAGPTNGSVSPLILTAGDGVTLTTSGTNRVVAIDTNVVAEISDLLWTNFTAAASEGTTVGISDVNPKVSVASFGANYLTNFNGGPSSLISLGYEAGSVGLAGVRASAVLNMADYAGSGQTFSNVYSVLNYGLFAGQVQDIASCNFIVNFGPYAGHGALVRGGQGIFNYGLRSGEFAILTNSLNLYNFGIYPGQDAQMVAMDNVYNFGYSSGAFAKGSNSSYIFNYGVGGTSGGTASRWTNSVSLFNFGYYAGVQQAIQQSTNIYNYGTYSGSNQFAIGANRYYAYGAYSGANSAVTNSADIYGFGSYALRDAHIHSSDRIFGLDYDAFEHAIITNCQSIGGYGFEAFESAVLAGSSNVVAIGPHAGTNLTLTGVSNIVIIGNIGTNVPTTDEFYLGRAQNTYRLPGNIGTIRGVSGYSWPTAHAAGVWTNDGAGNTGWKPLSDFISGGGGVASIFTNNVLAGGPGLTELEFTNTATVTWEATTNAGRVTMSATSAGGGSGIATNGGTGWDTTFRSVSTNTVPLRIEREAGLNLTNFLQVSTNGGVPFFVISSNKFVGIGTNSPIVPLHVFGNVNLRGTVEVFGNIMPGAGNSYTLGDAGSAKEFYAISTRRVIVGDSGQTVGLTKLAAAHLGIGVADVAPISGTLTASNIFLAGSCVITQTLANGVVAVSLIADNQSVSTTNRSYIQLSSDDGTAGNRTFVLSRGTIVGQLLDLEWTGTNAGELVDDFSATGGGNGRLSATWTPTQYDVLALRWNGTDWIERSRSTN